MREPDEDFDPVDVDVIEPHLQAALDAMRVENQQRREASIDHKRKMSRVFSMAWWPKRDYYLADFYLAPVLCFPARLYITRLWYALKGEDL